MSTWGHVILLYWNRWPRVLKENDRWRLEYWNKPGCHKSLDGLVMVLPWFRWWPAEVIPAFVAILARAHRSAVRHAHEGGNPEDCGCTKTHECEGHRG